MKLSTFCANKSTQLNFPRHFEIGHFLIFKVSEKYSNALTVLPPLISKDIFQIIIAAESQSQKKVAANAFSRCFSLHQVKMLSLSRAVYYTKHSDCFVLRP